jgi:hypothetical protein
MLGRSCSRSALRTGAGTDSPRIGSTAFPERAAQAAAGIANSGLSPDTTTTFFDGSPRAAEKKRSIAAARSYGSSPSITASL